METRGCSSTRTRRLAAPRRRRLPATPPRAHSPALSCRVLVLQAARDVDSEYNAIMNCVFAAQKLGVVVDTCVLSREPSTFMQQAADQTGGVHVHLQPDKAVPTQPLLQQLKYRFKQKQR